MDIVDIILRLIKIKKTPALWQQPIGEHRLYVETKHNIVTGYVIRDANYDFIDRITINDMTYSSSYSKIYFRIDKNPIYEYYSDSNTLTIISRAPELLRTDVKFNDIDSEFLFHLGTLYDSSYIELMLKARRLDAPSFDWDDKRNTLKYWISVIEELEKRNECF